MKIRNGFVSNSSSSSFICQVSGGIESGMDMSLSDFDMSQCSNGHEFYNQYRIETESNQARVVYAKEQLLDVAKSDWYVENYPHRVTEAVELLTLFDTTPV